ncbi:predicted protein [Pyrenophora tritici-repentis Pt-1C-BFP]|uniref:Uncharacterized protein n=1 Tax=Pyrenophora tritici-repentis (strain Pt-1C-BFP) TaxID=426418 RepID=B2VRQ2_PYRTR|nr:uncharacterized protein PTRG_00164 [Pyrenophora tritici-repentis Pt-1C-BFP]EDU39602.1 predicted protein [Pyrenophora tritici-repentis Pt-1C-BFP]
MPMPTVATSTTIPSTSDPVEWTQSRAAARGESGPAGKESRSVCSQVKRTVFLLALLLHRANKSGSESMTTSQRCARHGKRVVVGCADAGSSQLSFAALPQARCKRSGQQEGRSVDVSDGLRLRQQQPAVDSVSSPAGLTPQRAVSMVRLALQVRPSSAAQGSTNVADLCAQITHANSQFLRARELH